MKIKIVKLWSSSNASPEEGVWAGLVENEEVSLSYVRQFRETDMQNGVLIPSARVERLGEEKLLTEIVLTNAAAQALKRFLVETLG